jgi:phage terminase large subunit
LTAEEIQERALITQLYAKWRRDWSSFIESELGIKIWSGMRAVIRSVRENPRTSVGACHGISKTMTGAAIAVTFLNLYWPSIVITTAPTGRQVKELLWKEIRAIYQRNAVSSMQTQEVFRLEGDCQTLDIRVDPDRYMIGFSTDYATNIEGFHSPNILWVLDEAKGLPQWVYDSVEGSMTGGFTRVLEISTTDGADQQCPLRRHHAAERSKWNCIELSAYDSPFVDPAKAEADKESASLNQKLFSFGKPMKGAEWPLEMVSKIQVATEEWIDDHKDWRETRPDLWDTKVLGRFNERGEANVIPLTWVMSAVDAKVPEGGERQWGQDIARMGGDRCVLTQKVGRRVERQIVWAQCDTMETVGKILLHAREGTLKIDVCGLGAGVADRAREVKNASPMRYERLEIIDINSAEKSSDPEAYVNLRAEMWFAVRELFERQFKEGGVLAIPNDPELIEDLTGIRYKVLSDGRHQIEKKEEFRSRFGRSPDKGDSFVYCCYRKEPAVSEDIRAQMARRRLVR